MFLREVFFSRLYHRKVEDEAGRRIGLLHDVAISLAGYYPTVVGIRIGGCGYLPIASAAGGLAGEVLCVSSDAQLCELAEDEYYAAELLLDKQILDRTGRRIQRVNDLVFASYGEEEQEERCFFAGVDVGVRGICRRVGLEWLVRSRENRLIGWPSIAMVEDGDVPFCLTLSARELDEVTARDVALMCRRLDRRHRRLLLDRLSRSLVCEALSTMSTDERSLVLTALSCEEIPLLVRALPKDLQEEITAAIPPFYRYSRRMKGGDIP
ncbi:MAG: hypothetical protein IJ510_01535 [Selenomonadales bacterium]|nr:hypothetical protein [Selenomonadales bacterium]